MESLPRPPFPFHHKDHKNKNHADNAPGGSYWLPLHRSVPYPLYDVLEEGHFQYPSGPDVSTRPAVDNSLHSE